MSKEAAARSEAVPEDPWMEGRSASDYIKLCYRSYLEECHAGNIRHIRRRRKILTRQSWLDEYNMSFENTGLLNRTK